MKFNIPGYENVEFEKITTDGLSSEYYLDKDKKYFLKKPILFSEYDILKREIFIYHFLEKNNIDWCPKLLSYNDEMILLSYCGERINRNNKPKDFIQQINKIEKDLNRLKIKHNDIFKNDRTELIVKEDKIYLCDFGWCSIGDDFSCGINISNKPKPNHCFNNFRKLKKFLIKL